MTLPDAFAQYTRRLMGDELYSKLTAALAQEPPTSIRLNKAKCLTAAYGATTVDWCPDGLYLTDRPAFTFDPLLHAGWYYVQEASSMFLHRVISQYVCSPSLMLDLCAAPGGKSTCALGALPEGSALFCNEPVPLRTQILAENIQKWGRPEVVVTGSTPEDYTRSGLMFDAILCDVPCSGEGMFRKDEGSISEWSPQNVDRCATLQRQIVESAWQCLRPGGLLIYSTCTFNAKENEENIAWICRELGAELLPVDIDEAWGISGSLSTEVQGPVYRFIPGLTRGEGLFMAALRKGGNDDSCLMAPRRKQKRDNKKTGNKQVEEWLKEPEAFDITQTQDRIIATPKRLTPFYELAARKLRVVHAGITMGTAKGRDIIPDQSLAVSTELRREAFRSVELDYGQAVSYLRREPLSMPEGTPRGFILATYARAALGFVKNIGSRANNLYPQEWRIRSSHTPDKTALPHIFTTD